MAFEQGPHMILGGRQPVLRPAWWSGCTAQNHGQRTYTHALSTTDSAGVLALIRTSLGLSPLGALPHLLRRVPLWLTTRDSLTQRVSPLLSRQNPVRTTE